MLRSTPDVHISDARLCTQVSVVDNMQAVSMVIVSIKEESMAALCRLKGANFGWPEEASKELISHTAAKASKKVR